jgi:sugar phosphate isomerase/epimerase
MKRANRSQGAVSAETLNRRQLLKLGAAATSAMTVGSLAGSLRAAEDGAAEDSAANKPTEFQIACMTLPYRQFPLQRALTGLAGVGYKYVAWGTSHRESDADTRVPVMPTDAPPAKAKELGKRCRGLGLEPLMMFSSIYPENDGALEVLTNRLKQAAAAGMPQVLTFGHTQGGNRKIWIERFSKLGPIAADLNVMLVVKQHGGSTGTGEACAEITREVDHPNIRVNYDAGNVMDYLNVDPIPDIKKCADQVHSFCIKDHRNFPEDRDCGPGYGEIDHYRLLAPVAFTGRKMPLCCENIFAPVLPRPDKPEGVDALAKRAREYLEVVTAGLASLKPDAAK